MSNIRFDNITLLTENDGNNNKKSLSFTVFGNPPVQQRPKITYKTRKIPIYYDPSSSIKKLWKKQLHTSLVNSGYDSFPVFNDNDTNIMISDGLKIDVVFHFLRRKADYVTKKGRTTLSTLHNKYPGTKDTDNMLKFVMDALHDVVYDDDKCVVCTNASKRFVVEDNIHNGSYTTITISKI